MKNINFKTKDDKLFIEVDLSKTIGVSKSGKTVLIASTQGNIPLGKDDISLGLNCYKPNSNK